MLISPGISAGLGNAGRINQQTILIFLSDQSDTETYPVRGNPQGEWPPPGVHRLGPGLSHRIRDSAKGEKKTPHITTSPCERAQRSCDVFYFLLFTARPIDLFRRNLSYSVGEGGKDLYRKRGGLKKHFIIYENTRNSTSFLHLVFWSQGSKTTIPGSQVRLIVEISGNVSDWWGGYLGVILGITCYYSLRDPKEGCQLSRRAGITTSREDPRRVTLPQHDSAFSHVPRTPAPFPEYLEMWRTHCDKENFFCKIDANVKMLFI